MTPPQNRRPGGPQGAPRGKGPKKPPRPGRRPQPDRGTSGRSRQGQPQLAPEPPQAPTIDVHDPEGTRLQKVLAAAGIGLLWLTWGALDFTVYDASGVPAPVRVIALWFAVGLPIAWLAIGLHLLVAAMLSSDRVLLAHGSAEWEPGAQDDVLRGVRVRRWVTMHGFSVNLSPDLAHFGGIVPCGIADADVTSLEAEIGPVPTLAEMGRRMEPHLRELLAPFGVEAVSAGELNLPEPEETETSFVGNARIKAAAAVKATGLPALAARAVPEPATYWLLGAGLATVAGLARRRAAP